MYISVYNQILIYLRHHVMQESFTKAKEWVRELQHQGRHDVIIALAANKIDMEENRNVSRQVRKSKSYHESSH